MTDNGAARNVFRREGEYWTIAYDGTTLRLRDTKGLRYLAHLLLRPGEKISAAELIGRPPAVTAQGSGRDQGTQIVEADPAQLERARMTVTKGIKSAIRRIQEHDSALGYHLRAAVKTGAHCAYHPDPSRPISWKVGFVTQHLGANR